jgi:hypothetical protein
MHILSAYIVNKMLDHVLKVAPYTPTTHLYFTLYKGNPEDGGVVCPGATYLRTLCDNWEAAVPATRNIINTDQSDFPEAGADWSYIDFVGIEDEAANLIGKFDLAPPITGTRTSDVIFTRTAGTWTIDAEIGKYVWAYVEGSYNGGAWFPIADNDTTTITITGVLTASCNRIKIAMNITLGMNLYIEAEAVEVEWVTGGVCNTWAALMLDHIFMNTPLSVPTNLYLGLSTADPTDDASGIAEPVGNNYSRPIFNTWHAAALKIATNDGVLDSPVASGPWGVITHSFISDHLTNVVVANIIFYGELDTPLTIGDGDKLRYPDEDLQVVVDAA